MTLSQVSWLMLVVQLVLLTVTAFVAPLKLRPRIGRYLCYTIAACVAWLAYAIAAMLFDSKAGHDVPGIGYLLIGFLGWLVGSGIFLVRAVESIR